MRVPLGKNLVVHFTAFGMACLFSEMRGVDAGELGG